MVVRRMATVMSSAPLASTAWRVSSRSLYLPVPTSRRDWYSPPAMMSGSRSVCAMAVSWYCNKERGIIARACCAAQSLESPAPLAPFISSRAFDGAALGPCGVRLTHDHDYRGACRRLNRLFLSLVWLFSLWLSVCLLCLLSVPRGRSPMAELQLPKQIAWVRFPSPAPTSRSPAHRACAAQLNSEPARRRWDRNRSDGRLGPRRLHPFRREGALQLLRRETAQVLRHFLHLERSLGRDVEGIAQETQHLLFRRQHQCVRLVSLRELERLFRDLLGKTPSHLVGVLIAVIIHAVTGHVPPRRAAPASRIRPELASRHVELGIDQGLGLLHQKLAGADDGLLGFFETKESRTYSIDRDDSISIHEITCLPLRLVQQPSNRLIKDSHPSPAKKQAGARQGSANAAEQLKQEDPGAW